VEKGSPDQNSEWNGKCPDTRKKGEHRRRQRKTGPGSAKSEPQAPSRQEGWGSVDRELFSLKKCVGGSGKEKISKTRPPIGSLSLRSIS